MPEFIDGVEQIDATRIRGKRVSTTAPTNGQVMTYDSAADLWVPATLAEADISDLVHDATKIRGKGISTTPPANEEVLRYNASTDEYEPGEAGAGGGSIFEPAESLVLGKSGTNSMKTPFAAKVNGNPTSTSVPYDGDSQETSILPGMVLHNTTKNEKVKITDINTATNTITVEADSPDDANTWDDNDNITTASQTNTGRSGVYVDVDVTDFVPDGFDIAVFEFLARCNNAAHYFFIHPYEAYSSWKEVSIETQVVGGFFYRTAFMKIVTENARQYITFCQLSCAAADGRVNIRYLGAVA